MRVWSVVVLAVVFLAVVVRAESDSSGRGYWGGAVVLDTYIDSPVPEFYTRSRSAEFYFSSTDSSAGFQCALGDESVYESCSSPKVYQGLGDGRHFFYVRAVRSAGEVDASPAVYSWNEALWGRCRQL
jgi:hypothetical protein